MQSAGDGSPEPDVPGLILEYLESKSFFSSQRAFNAELALALHEASSASGGERGAKDLFHSKLERLLGVKARSPSGKMAIHVQDLTPAAVEPEPTQPEQVDRASRNLTKRPRAQMIDMKAVASSSGEQMLRARHREATSRQQVIFHDPPASNAVDNGDGQQSPQAKNEQTRHFRLTFR